MKSSRGDLFEQVDLVRRVAIEHEAGPLVDSSDPRKKLFIASALRSICYSLAALDWRDRGVEVGPYQSSTLRVARSELVGSQILLISDLLIESAFGAPELEDRADRTRILGDLLESLTRLQELVAVPW